MTDDTQEPDMIIFAVDPAMLRGLRLESGVTLDSELMRLSSLVYAITGDRVVSAKNRALSTAASLAAEIHEQAVPRIPDGPGMWLYDGDPVEVVEASDLIVMLPDGADYVDEVTDEWEGRAP